MDQKDDSSIFSWQLTNEKPVEIKQVILLFFVKSHGIVVLLTAIQNQVLGPKVSSSDLTSFLGVQNVVVNPAAKFSEETTRKLAITSWMKRKKIHSWGQWGLKKKLGIYHAALYHLFSPLLMVRPSSCYNFFLFFFNTLEDELLIFQTIESLLDFQTFKKICCIAPDGSIRARVLEFFSSKLGR